MIPRAHVTAWRDNPWYPGRADVQTYKPEELLATKLRALYQRRKGRDLYDLWLALTSLALDDERVIECFERYVEQGGHRISRAEFEVNLTAKLGSPGFLEDLAPLLPAGANYDASSAAALVHERLVAKLRGDPWKGGASSRTRIREATGARRKPGRPR